MALGGGTARATAHVGALKVLEQAGLSPDMIAGTSSGGILAALYAMGSHATALEHIVRSQNTTEVWAQAVDFGLHRAGLIHGKRLMNWLDRKFFYGATFADTEIPLVITCTDVETGELVFLREGSLAKAVVASCALPGIFAPFEWDGRWLIDGGFVSTVPFQALENNGLATIIGLHAGVRVEQSSFIKAVRRMHNSSLGQWYEKMLQTFPLPTAWHLLNKGMVRVIASYSQTLTAPEESYLVNLAPPIAWWDFHRSPEAIQAGEAAMAEALASLPLSVRIGG